MTSPSHDHSVSGGEPQEAPLDLHAAFRLVNDAEAKARQELYGNEAVIYVIWGTAWLLGYGTLHGSRFGWLPVGSGQGLAVHGGCILAALVSTVVLISRRNRVIRGHSSYLGALYGGGWALGFLTMGCLGAVVGAMTADFWLRSMALNGIAILIVGLMYLAGGAMFNDRNQAVLGVWFLVVNVVSLLAGPLHFLTVLAVLGPLGFFGAAVAGSIRRRSPRAGA
ncbi:hypothetical protein [Arthrobacter mangrovi]|uniref:Transporter n=1 Tax=Arthrobacter mangrovi TaxID=2966350 RepID=A0ABQ5MXN4_9MICC|nr:hypothetical protein [Arthrobacter mangrovi]GLB68726.1 hypothetical protein AHIS1636_31680 [Arthrobacter mangrovi]